jgi:hypothetical protein
MASLKRRLERLEGSRVRTAIIFVWSGETDEEAWQRNLAEHPEDEKAETVIYVTGDRESPNSAD